MNNVLVNVKLNKKSAVTIIGIKVILIISFKLFFWQPERPRFTKFFNLSGSCEDLIRTAGGMIGTTVSCALVSRPTHLEQFESNLEFLLQMGDIFKGMAEEGNQSRRQKGIR